MKTRSASAHRFYFALLLVALIGSLSVLPAVAEVVDETTGTTGLNDPDPGTTNTTTEEPPPPPPPPPEDPVDEWDNDVLNLRTGSSFEGILRLLSEWLQRL